MLLPALGKKELKVCVGKAAQLPAEAEILLFTSVWWLGKSQFQIQTPLSRLRTKTPLPLFTLRNQDELVLGLGRLAFIAVHRFGALRSVIWLVELPGWSLRVLPSQPGGQPRPPGDGSRDSSAPCPPPRPSAGGCAGEGWPALPVLGGTGSAGSAATEGWAVGSGQREHRAQAGCG